jgi:hypothetical protein
LQRQQVALRVAFPFRDSHRRFPIEVLRAGSHGRSSEGQDQEDSNAAAFLPNVCFFIFIFIFTVMSL